MIDDDHVTIIVQEVMKGKINAWHLQNVIEHIREVLSSFESFVVSHIKRGGNVEANVLSKWALNFGETGEFRLEDFRGVKLVDLGENTGVK